MGRNGDLLRQAKKDKVTYTFTRAELEEHDLQVRRDYAEAIRRQTSRRLDEEMKRQREALDAHIREEWDKRTEQFVGTGFEDSFMASICCLVSVSVRVLVEQFGWKPVKDGRHYRLCRFADCVADELARISSDELADIRKYNEEVYEKYGVKFNAVETEG